MTFRLPDELPRRVLDQNSLGILITDVNGKITYANQRQLVATGYTAEELVGQPMRIFNSGHTSVDVYKNLWATILAGDIWHGELTNRARDGHPMRELVRISPICDANGEISHFFCIKEPSFDSQLEAILAGTGEMLDPVTRMPNRSMLLRRLDSQIRDSRASGITLALVCLELDQVPTITESFGRTATDTLLTRTAQRLGESIRQSDMVARTDTNQFTLLLTNTDTDHQLDDLARRMLSTISTPLDLQGRSTSVTASIGIALCPTDADSALPLLMCAQSALGNAKSEGGDCFYRYCAEHNNSEQLWEAMVAALRQAIADDSITLYYQPKVDFETGKVIGLEALTRWHHPTLGAIPPDRFIPLAEETGLINDISRWVILHVARQLQEWRNAGIPVFPVGINLSLRHFRYGELPKYLQEVLATSGVDPSLIQLEISESALMRDPNYALMIVDRIRSLGVTIALDEFGSGASSLYFLSRLHVDKLKINQAFVRDITTNPVSASIVSAIVAMAHKLGKRVVAVGVETEGQALQLKHYGCDELQGYYYSPPTTAAEMVHTLKASQPLALNSTPPGERTLLLVDDEANILSTLQRSLRRENYRILVARSGAEALDILATSPVQVVVSDHRMPGMSGVELLTRVRDLYPSTARIILSGYADITTLTDAINHGAIWKYISKPWQPDDLKVQIRQAFALRP
jgi:diguanylate cyclase (GGDEF)-like protein/PAS domain S-box-containing protein